MHSKRLTGMSNASARYLQIQKQFLIRLHSRDDSFLITHNMFEKTNKKYIVNELIVACDAGRRERVVALYSAVLGLLSVISRARPRLILSPVPQNIIIAVAVVIVLLKQEMHIGFERAVFL